MPNLQICKCFSLERKFQTLFKKCSYVCMFLDVPAEAVKTFLLKALVLWYSRSDDIGLCTVLYTWLINMSNSEIHAKKMRIHHKPMAVNTFEKIQNSFRKFEICSFLCLLLVMEVYISHSML